MENLIQKINSKLDKYYSDSAPTYMEYLKSDEQTNNENNKVTRFNVASEDKFICLICKKPGHATEKFFLLSKAQKAVLNNKQKISYPNQQRYNTLYGQRSNNNNFSRNHYNNFPNNNFLRNKNYNFNNNNNNNLQNRNNNYRNNNNKFSRNIKM